MKKITKILKALTFAFIITALVAIMMVSVNAAVTNSGTFANESYPNATWTWELHDDGTLYIGGTGTGTTEFFYGGNSSDAGKQNIPWLNGTLNRKNITKVVFAEETGITSLGQYALYYLESAKEIVIPSTVTKLDTHCFRRLFSLETISVHGKTDAGEGVYDLRNITSMGKAFSEAAKSVSGPIELWFGEGAITFPKITDAWYMPATSIIFRVVEGSTADTALSAFVERQKGTSPDTNSSTNVEMAYFETSEEPDVPERPTIGTSKNGQYSWEIDVATGTLTFTNNGHVQFLFNDTETAFLDWVELWRNDIRHIVVPDFARYKFDTNNYDHPFANLPNLETVEWNTPIIQSMVRGKTTKGMFYGCEKLTTFGSSETFETGVINLSGLTFEYTNANNYSVSMFAGCESIKKVVFGNAMYLKDMNVANELDFIVGKSMFEGCTALESVEFEKVEGLLASAFKGCSSLKGDITYLGDPAIADAFKGCGGVVIHTDDVEKVKTMLDSMETAGVKPGEAMVSGMVHGGFAVRVAGYNGLRSFYTFVGEDNATYDSLTLVEYGSILASENTYALYTKDIGGILRLNGTEFVTPDANKVVKKALYMADGYTGEVETKKRINDDGTVEFVVTAVNFKVENYNSEIVMNGYEIWKDSNNNYILILSDYPKEEYKSNSLYKTTMAMLVADHIEIGAETAPVYNTITQIAGYKTFDCGVENISSFVVPHHLAEGKMIAVYMTDSEEEIVLNDLGITADLGIVMDYVFDGNIKFDIPEIDTYWKEHISAQLATLPAGKSFIAITDTHYPSNAGKSADLIQYVRKVTGIEKVLNLGDPYSGEDTYNEALASLELSMKTKFFDYFGEDGLYAVGNHDSNLTKARNTGDDNDQTYFMDILLSDEDIYNLTFVNIEEGAEKNNNIVYDEALLDLIEEAYAAGDIEAFVLENVAANDAASHDNLFGNVNYSAEEMYNNLVCWAKMHYAYYDHESKICYLVLNTGALTVTDFATLGRELWKFHPSQYNFVEKILKEVAQKDEPYDIVVAGHMLYDSEEPGDGHLNDFHSMLSAFRAGTSVTFTGKGNNPLSGQLFGCEDGEMSRTLSYDFSDVDFAGNIFCITGHIHKDLDFVTQTDDEGTKTGVDYDSIKDNICDNAILCLLLEDDNVGNIGTIDEHSFTILTITEENTLVATRIGRQDGGWAQKIYNLG